MTSRWKLFAFAAASLLGLSTPASAQSYTLLATLTGAGEATQVANGINTGAFGDATVVVDLAARTDRKSTR